MINYVDVARETWATAAVRKKLSNILFCFYRWRPDKDIDSWPVDTLHLWRPDARQFSLLEDDWRKIHAKIAAGEAHLLSESDTHILGAATKAANSGVRRPQLPGGPPAKPRAFALKQSFVAALYEYFTRRPDRLESLMQNLGIDKPSSFESTLLDRLAPFVGRTVSDVAAAAAIGESISKGFTASVVRATVKKLMGVNDPRARIREFDEFGIDIKIVPVRAHGVVKESMSFPAFKHLEVIHEDWDTSDFRRQTSRLLIVPIHEPRRGAAPREWSLGRPFFWSPDAVDEEVMRGEWNMFRDLIAVGRANDLPTAAETRIVHVRPKARDSNDRDLAPSVGLVVKKSFWLNSHFVRTLVERYEQR
jgi:DNA mismatch repair endonuclease MutH